MNTKNVTRTGLYGALLSFYAREGMLARVLAAVVCLYSVRHMPVLYRNGCMRIVLIFAYTFPSTYATLCGKSHIASYSQ